MRRFHLSRSKWVQIFFYAFSTLLLSVLPLRGDEQKADKYVDSHRASLKKEQRAYLQALSKPDPAEAVASDYIEILREEVKKSIFELIKASGGSEVELAYRKASIKYHLDVIHAYEEAFGERGKPKTTEWNVFTSQELAALKEEANANFQKMRRSVLQLPPADVAPQLRNRMRELTWQLSALEGELTSRPAGETPSLRKIDPDISVRDARKHALIAEVDGPGRTKHGERILKFEIATRANILLKDASLESAKTQVAWAPNTDLETGRGNRGPPPWMTDLPPEPPSKIPPSPNGPRGPPVPALGDVPTRLKDLVFDELNATRERQDLKRVQARAELNAGKNVLAAALRPDNVSEFSVLDKAELDSVRDSYAEWHKKLLAEKLTAGEIAELLREIKEVGKINEEIKAEYNRRAQGSAIAGKAEFTRALELTGESTSVRALRSSYLVQYQAELSRLLRLELDNPRAVPDPRLKTAFDEAVRSRLWAEVERINTLWDKTRSLESVVLREGRGPAGVLAGRQLLLAKQELHSAGKELADRIAKTYPGNTRPPGLPALNPQIIDTPLSPGTATGSVERAATNLVEVQVVADRLSEPSTRERVQVRSDKGQPEIVRFRDRPSSTPMTRKPLEANYENLFPQKEDWTREFKKLTEETIESLKKAPGGVIVDGNLSDPLLQQIEEVRFDLKSDSLQVRTGGKWKTIAPRIDGETLRIAYAFVLDGRIAAVDLREPVGSELKWLIGVWLRVMQEPMNEEDKRLMDVILTSLTSINLHPSLADTAVGLGLIESDQLVFDLLPISNLRREADEFKNGISLAKLRELYTEDEAAALRDSRYDQALFFKSILSARNVSPREGNDISQLRAQFDFRVYHVPIRFQRSGDWYEHNQDKLITARPELALLEKFAIAVAICRAVRKSSLRNNFDTLAAIECREVTTPRFTVTKANKLGQKMKDLLSKLLESQPENESEGKSP